MSWYTLYQTTTGDLRGHTSTIPNPVPSGMTLLTTPDRMDQLWRWNSTTKAWDIPIPVPVTVDRLDDLVALPYLAPVWQALSPTNRARLRDTFVWLLGTRRERQPTEDVPIDVGDDWPDAPVPL